MNRPSTDIIMRVSAALLGGMGLILLFTPAESAMALGWGEGEIAPALAGAGLLAVAILDWMGRTAVYGGIYGRPIVMANLMLSLVGGLTLLNGQIDNPQATTLGWLPVLILAAHGTTFWLMMRGRIGGARGPKLGD